MWRLLIANLLVVFGGAVVGTTLTRRFVITGAFTPLTHAAMVLAAIAVSAFLTWIILHLAFRPLRALREAIEQTGDAATPARPRSAGPLAPARLSATRSGWMGDPDIMAVANAVEGLWDRLDQHVRLLEDGNRRLEAQRAELAEKTEQLRLMASQVLAAQEEERRRLARELHDDTMQSMAALIMGLERGVEAMSPDQPQLRRAHDTVARLRDVAAGILDDLRHLALDLRPAVLDDHGLAAALRWLAETHRERTGLTVITDIDPVLMDESAARLPPAVETGLYRIAQEALSNATRHAAASRAWLRLEVSHSRAVVEIEDDGTGFDTNALRGAGQMGLFNMRERASLLGGALSITRGRSGRGTLVRAHVPLIGAEVREGK